MEEDEEEVVKKSSEGKDGDGEKAEKQEAGGQVWFAPVTRTVFWPRELNTNWLVSVRLLDGQPVGLRERVPPEK